LVAEIARHPKKTRDVFTDRVSEFIPMMAERIGKGSADERRRNATAIYGMMIGALQLARAVSDKKLSDEILENALEAALRLAGESETAAQ
jgi:hypothetical protein